MNLKQLQSFVEVAEHGSLARAAVATDQVPSLISRHIASLESAWGDRLFDRTGRGMVVSEFGRRMLPEVRAALDGIGRLDALASATAGVPTGTVHLGVLPSLSRQLLPLLFADLRSRAPGVRLRATEGFSGDLDEQLASGRLDLAVINRYGRSVAVDEEVLGRADTYLVGKAGSPLLAGDAVPFKALAGIPLVLPTVPNGLRATLDQLARRHAVRLDIVMEVDSSSSMKDVAQGGDAYTLLPLMALQDELGRGTLAAAKVVSPRIVRTIALAVTSQKPATRASRLVGSRVRELAPGLVS